ncbi:MAG: iron-containing alcohol dehydrogenase [Planctomycetes bacterium]|nr:iron-containing alcohol dehydrogenase [Planctomycetota bacterium]
MHFEFATSNRIIFGRGTLSQVGDLTQALGNKAFVVTGRSPERAASLLTQFESHGPGHTCFQVPGEPSVDLVTEAVDLARQGQCDLVIAMGGGSVLDTGKAVAAMLTNQGDLLTYLEVVGQGKALTCRPVPMIAIPTTAGTGAEVTSNAVLAVPEHRRKVSMRHAWMLPDVALIDSELTHALPPGITATTGMDAITQLIEPFVSRQNNPLTDSLCREGLLRAARSLKTAFSDGTNAQAREDMAMASLFGGLALANAKLGAVHGFAGPIGGLTNAPHGAVCGRLLPAVMEANVKALQETEPDSPALARYQALGPLLTGIPQAGAADAVTWVQDLCKTLEIPTLKQFGLTTSLIPEIARQSRDSSSMKGNPVELGPEALEVILLKSL